MTPSALSRIYVKAIADACARSKEGRPDEFVEVTDTEEAADADSKRCRRVNWWSMRCRHWCRIT